MTERTMSREEALRLLRGGAEGISEWNRLRAAGVEVPSLIGADLDGKVLIWANLRSVELKGASLGQADMEGADLIGTHLEGAVLIGTHLEGAHIDAAHLEGAYLAGAHLEGAILHEAHLEGANLKLAFLEGAVMWGAHLQGTNLRKSDIRRADLRHAGVGDYLCEADARAPHAGRALRRTIFGEVKYDEHTKILGLDTSAANFADSALFKRHIEDEQYLVEYRRNHRGRYWLWKVSSDCGRSLTRFALWAVLGILVFAWLYSGAWPVPPEFLAFARPEFNLEYQTWFTDIYFSTVTFTTLGFGDVRPTNAAGQIWTTIEFIVGYVMLGALISILANKFARRA